MFMIIFFAVFLILPLTLYFCFYNKYLDGQQVNDLATVLITLQILFLILTIGMFTWDVLFGLNR